MKNFTELKHCYRVQVNQFSNGKTFVSNECFDNYEEAWEYAKNNTSEFEPCGFCIIELNEPEINFNINFDESKFEINRGVSNA